MELHKKNIETINGIDINFIALNEDVSLCDLLPEESEEEIKNIYKSNVVFCAKIEATYKGIELASDYLGGCIYESYEDFYNKYKEDYFKQMYESVLHQAEKEIHLLREKFNNLTIKI
jgi:hypothetical protein